MIIIIAPPVNVLSPVRVSYVQWALSVKLLQIFCVSLVLHCVALGRYANPPWLTLTPVKSVHLCPTMSQMK